MLAAAGCLLLLAATGCGSPLPEQLYEDSPCQTDTGVGGVCRKVAACPWAQGELMANRRPKICAFDKTLSIVCCPTEETAANTTSVQRISEGAYGIIAKQKCKEYAQYVFGEEDSVSLIMAKERVDYCVTTADPLIVGGREAKPREFPHMAQIGFDGENGTIDYKCGGSLISPDFVLTAAHCLYAGSLPAKWVQLGDLDRASDLDSAKPEVIAIAEPFRHPDYKPPSKYNDIALLRLAKSAAINGFVRPACLHTQPALRPRSKPDGPNDEEVPLASGWGNTDFQGEPSDRLMVVGLRITEQQQCDRVYPPTSGKIAKGILHDSQLCAGASPGGTQKDTCQGDSGGPLQVMSNSLSSDPYCMYKIVGVTSFGSACGIAPGVYTRVFHFVPWIEKIVWP